MSPRSTITRLKVDGFRTIDSLDMDLSGLTVLIGPNGSGKSTILEALAILKLAAQRPMDFGGDFARWHGGIWDTLRRGPKPAERLRLGVELDFEGKSLAFEFSVFNKDGYPSIEHEKLAVAGQPLFERRGGDATTGTDLRSVPTLHPSAAAIPQLKGRLPAATALVEALEGMDLHAGFPNLPGWVAAHVGLRSPAREPAPLERTRSLALLGANLANAYHELIVAQSKDHWAETMEYVRLGLGPGFEDIRPQSVHGQVSLSIRLRGAAEDIPLSALSEGQLAYLALVAIFRLNAERTLLGFDGPDLHLHPATLMRAVDMFEHIAKRCPVILATHSDAMLDHLSAPAESIRVCDIDEDKWATRVHRLDASTLDTWLPKYRGRFGALRADGYLGVVTRFP